MKIKLTISFGDDAAWMNQSCVRKSWIDFFSVELECGHCVPGKRRKKPLVDPKYCHETAESRSKLFAKIGSKCVDQVIDDWTIASENNERPILWLNHRVISQFIFLIFFYLNIEGDFIPLKLTSAGTSTELCVKFTTSFSKRRIGFGGISLMSSDM